jgi:tetratricopeptide (TPR) repeat protein
MTSRLRTIAIGVSALALIGLLFLLPRYKKPVTNEKQPVLAFDAEKFEKQAQAKLESGLIEKLKSFNSSVPGYFDSLATFWDVAQNPGISAYYWEKIADKNPSEKSFINAAYRYFDAYKMAKDSAESSYFVNKAITCYSEVLKINPDNLNAKTDLGICYAEGTSEPMKGIMLLREVVEKNPEHENAQLNLGFLSVKSGQYDKALERFKKVLEINPSRIDTYIFMGQTYLQMGRKQDAINSFKTFKSLSANNRAIAEIDAYIKELESDTGSK